MTTPRRRGSASTASTSATSTRRSSSGRRSAWSARARPTSRSRRKPSSRTPPRAARCSSRSTRSRTGPSTWAPRCGSSTCGPTTARGSTSARRRGVPVRRRADAARAVEHDDGVRRRSRRLPGGAGAAPPGLTRPRRARYFSGEKSVGLRSWLRVWCVSGPSRSVSSNTCCHSGSLMNDAHAGCRAPRSS